MADPFGHAAIPEGDDGRSAGKAFRQDTGKGSYHSMGSSMAAALPRSWFFCSLFTTPIYLICSPSKRGFSSFFKILLLFFQRGDISRNDELAARHFCRCDGAMRPFTTFQPTQEDQGRRIGIYPGIEIEFRDGRAVINRTPVASAWKACLDDGVGHGRVDNMRTPILLRPLIFDGVI